MEKPVKRRAGFGVLALFLAVSVFCSACFFDPQEHQYKKAQAYLAEGQYTEASQIFAELGEYQDAPQLLQECQYAQADQLVTNGECQAAIEAFQALGAYQDSPQKVFDCYFALGEDAYSQESYEEAVGYFLQAGKSQAVQEALDKAYYNWGHQLFVKGLYVAAENKFACIQTMPEDAQPHFRYLEDAREYLKEQADNLESDISCYISQRPIPPPADSLWEVVSNYVPFQHGNAYYDDDAKTLEISARYHAGVRIFRAWETQDYSDLSDAELEALELAQEVVDQAMLESQDPLEIELYLYNWLCDHVEYESPDMDVDEETYMQLRQLSCLGALLDGKANCQGYTDAFYLLGNLAGFEVCKINGTGEWEPHTWNGIWLEDKLYLVDVTFGDAGTLWENGKIYTWFNSPYDPAMYTIDGGEEVFPGLVTDNDLSQSYYSNEHCVFSSMNDAAYHLLQQYKFQGAGWSFAMIEGAELEDADFDKALEDNFWRAGVSYCSCTWLLNTYCGNTYLAVLWE